MKRLPAVFFLLVFLFANSYANEFIVKSFSKLKNDPSACKYIKYDTNGDACALIKVRTDIPEVIQFDSNRGVPVAPELKGKGEYWVYVTEGERALKCMADTFKPTRIPIKSAGKIKALTVYELRLSSKKMNIEKLQVVITTDPPDAEKWIDGELLGTGDIFKISSGTYELNVKKLGYKSYTSILKIDKDNFLFKDIILNKDILKQEIPFTGSPELIFIQGGTFQMSSNDGSSDKKRTHTVTVSDFYMGKYEVSQELYEDIMGANPSYFLGNDHPVEQVSWYNAVTFCNKMSEKVGLQQVYTISGTNVTIDFNKNGYRLPSEAEWEFAARGGNASQGYTYSGSNTVANVAWYSGNSGIKTYPVGQKRSNELGLYDMSGNVYELCWDWYGDYSVVSQYDPTGPISGVFRVLRGGSWRSSIYCQVAFRNSYHPSSSSSDIGFRIALSPGD